VCVHSHEPEGPLRPEGYQPSSHVPSSWFHTTATGFSTHRARGYCTPIPDEVRRVSVTKHTLSHPIATRRWRPRRPERPAHLTVRVLYFPTTLVPLEEYPRRQRKRVTVLPCPPAVYSDVRSLADTRGFTGEYISSFIRLRRSKAFVHRRVRLPIKPLPTPQTSHFFHGLCAPPRSDDTVAGASPQSPIHTTPQRRSEDRTTGGCRA